MTAEVHFAAHPLPHDDRLAQLGNQVRACKFLIGTDEGVLLFLAQLAPVLHQVAVTILQPLNATAKIVAPFAPEDARTLVCGPDHHDAGLGDALRLASAAHALCCHWIEDEAKEPWDWKAKLSTHTHTYTRAFHVKVACPQTFQNTHVQKKK